MILLDDSWRFQLLYNLTTTISSNLKKNTVDKWSNPVSLYGIVCEAVVRSSWLYNEQKANRRRVVKPCKPWINERMIKLQRDNFKCLRAHVYTLSTNKAN